MRSRSSRRRSTSGSTCLILKGSMIVRGLLSLIPAPSPAVPNHGGTRTGTPCPDPGGASGPLAERGIPAARRLPRDERDRAPQFRVAVDESSAVLKAPLPCEEVFLDELNSPDKRSSARKRLAREPKGLRSEEHTA